MRKSPQTVTELMQAHRSIRKFKPEELSEELISKLVGVAQFASTSSYTQPYSVIHVIDPAKKKALRGFCGDQKYVEESGAFLVFLADLRKLKLASELQNTPFQQGYIEMLITAITDTSILAQNLLLAAESMDLGGVYIGGLRNHPEEVCNLLEIPKLVLPLFGMSLGVPDQAPILRPRLPLDTVLMTDRYVQIDAERVHGYDEAVKEYYIERTKGKLDHSWTEQMAEKMQGELRPHMWEFLVRQGLLER